MPGIPKKKPSFRRIRIIDKGYYYGTFWLSKPLMMDNDMMMVWLLMMLVCNDDDADGGYGDRI
jgi:hypothetical protein